MPVGDDLVGGNSRDVGAVENDASGARRRKSQDRADKSGFAGAVGAEQTGNAAGFHCERDALQHISLVIGGVDVIDLEHVGHHATPR